jgi:Protein of unknown function (DUF1579)
MTSSRLKPAPEVSQLAYFVGDWIAEGIIEDGPWGAGGEFAWSEATSWMTGGFFIVGHWDFQMPDHLGGGGEELFVMGYDVLQKAYSFTAFSSQGLHLVSRGTLNGNTWTWESEAIHEGRPRQQKMTIEMLSANTYTMKFEICDDGAHWMTFMRGQARRK